MERPTVYGNNRAWMWIEFVHAVRYFHSQTVYIFRWCTCKKPFITFTFNLNMFAFSLFRRKFTALLCYKLTLLKLERKWAGCFFTARSLKKAIQHTNSKETMSSRHIIYQCSVHKCNRYHAIFNVLCFQINHLLVWKEGSLIRS